MKNAIHIKSYLLPILVITLAVGGLYWQVGTHDFVNYDDPDYVTRNSLVSKGLHPDAIVRAFTATQAANWHPVTWLSHMLDVELFGLNAAGHHLTSILLHGANSVLLYLLFYLITGRIRQSMTVALLFAVHPLHVESVAWIAERKDLLCTFFGMLSLLAYARYVKTPSPGRYLTGLAFFAVALMSKPMLVTLPILLILIDFWPFDRFNRQPESSAVSAYRLLTEKVPFFVLSLLSCVITYTVQQRGGAVVPLEQSSLLLNTGNAVIAYVSYILKMLWPANLCVFYPFDTAAITAWRASAAIGVLSVITTLAIRCARNYPYILFGWSWFLVTLIPVIGIVRVGDHAMSDRYTHIPLIGLFVIAVWGVSDVFSTLRITKTAMAVLTALVLSTLSVATYRQIQFWRSSIPLFERTLSVSGDSWLAHNNLGMELKKIGRYDNALTHYFMALQIKPDAPATYNNIGNLYRLTGRNELAVSYLSRAITMKTGYADAHFNLALAYLGMGKMDGALSELNLLAAISSEDAEELRRILFR